MDFYEENLLWTKVRRYIPMHLPFICRSPSPQNTNTKKCLHIQTHLLLATYRWMGEGTYSTFLTFHPSPNKKFARHQYTSEYLTRNLPAFIYHQACNFRITDEYQIVSTHHPFTHIIPWVNEGTKRNGAFIRSFGNAH